MRFLYAIKSSKVSAFTLALTLAITGMGLAQSAPKAKTDARAASAQPSDFDAARAYNHVKSMVEFGPHPSGSEAIKKVQEYI